MDTIPPSYRAALDRYDAASEILLRQNPQLAPLVREFQIKNRFYAFLTSMMRRYKASVEELARLTGNSESTIREMLEHPPQHPFETMLSQEECIWLKSYTLSGARLREV